MTKKKVPSQLLRVATPAIPQNAIQRADARQQGLITGFLSNRKRGAPLKLHNNPKVPRHITQVSATATTPTTIIAATVVAAPAPSKFSTASRGPYINWKIEPFKSALDRATEASLKDLDPQEAAGDIIIPSATLQRRVQEMTTTASEMGGLDCLYLHDFSCHSNGSTRSLISELDRNYIQQLIIIRDIHNDCMTRPEVIVLIQKMANCNFVKAEQHWHYCRRKKLSLS